MKWSIHIALAACALGAAGNLSGQANHPVGSLADSYNNFGLKLLVNIRQAAPQKNVFISPAGLALVMSMVADGARAETLQEIRSTLQINGPMDLNHANQALLEQLLGLDPTVKLEIANSVWTAQDAPVKPSFMADMRQFYRAESASVNFKDPATAGKINNWVSEHTQGKIPRMVEPPLDQNRMILIDAVYFKGDWMTTFDKKLTQDKPFSLEEGSKISHPRMSRSGEFAYYEDDGCQAVRLPYVGRRINMYVVLPKTSLSGFLQDLTLDRWRKMVLEFQSRRGTLGLPRFKLKNEFHLNEILAAMGMPQAFTDKADFSGLSDEPLYIGWVKQKTYVDVNEEGTEAAAVSGIGMRAMVMQRPSSPFQMIVDRPFFVAIGDSQSGVILFLGAIMDPRS